MKGLCVESKIPSELFLHPLFQVDKSRLVITFSRLFNATDDLMHIGFRISGREINLPGVSLSDFFRCIGEVDDKFSFCLSIAIRQLKLTQTAQSQGFSPTRLMP